MYMHLFTCSAPRNHQELKIGQVYQVTGYYTGDFTGKCVEVDGGVAMFLVNKGEEVPVQIESTYGGKVKIERV